MLQVRGFLALFTALVLWESLSYPSKIGIVTGKEIDNESKIEIETFWIIIESIQEIIGDTQPYQTTHANDTMLCGNALAHVKRLLIIYSVYFMRVCETYGTLLSNSPSYPSRLHSCCCFPSIWQLVDVNLCAHGWSSVTCNMSRCGLTNSCVIMLTSGGDPPGLGSVISPVLNLKLYLL